MVEVIIKIDLDDGYFLDPDVLLEIGRDIANTVTLASANNRCRISSSQSQRTMLAEE